MRRQHFLKKIIPISIIILALTAGVAAQSYAPIADDSLSFADGDDPTPAYPIEEEDPVQPPEYPSGGVEQDTGLSTGLIVGIIAAVVILIIIGFFLGRQTNKPESSGSNLDKEKG